MARRRKKRRKPFRVPAGFARKDLKSRVLYILHRQKGEPLEVNALDMRYRPAVTALDAEKTPDGEALAFKNELMQSDDFLSWIGAPVIVYDGAEQSGKLIETIDPQRAFEKGDILFLAGTKGGLNRLSDWAKKNE